jgi:radical SAM family uncharacterized protein
MISWKLIQKTKAVLERERGTVYKPRGGKISICLIYPNHYHVGMSNLGFQTVYRELNAADDVVCERAFLPDSEDLSEFESSQTPLFSLESQRPVGDFDILAFSVSFENDFVNILTLLGLARVPLEAQERGEAHPLVIAGGVAVFLNPEPLADFFDLFVIGEAEELIPEFLDVCRGFLANPNTPSKDALLRSLAGLEGIYVPSLYQVSYRGDGTIASMEPAPGTPARVRRRWVKELDRFPSVSTLFTPDTEFKDMAMVEVNRGCPRGCRFCGACFAYAPFRNRSLPVLQSVSEKALQGERRIGLTGTAVSDYPHLESLCESILDREGGVTLSSLRVDAVRRSLIRCLKQGDLRTVSMAPEAGSERLRRVLRKGYREEEVLKAAAVLADEGLRQIKCYFMIGLPFEEDEDVKAIPQLAKRIRHEILSSGSRPKEAWRLVLSVNPFVPKPGTPFQWEPLVEVPELKKRLNAIRNGLKQDRGISVIYDLPKWAYLQALLSRGDRRVGKILLAVYRNRGDWGKALRETSLNPDFFVYRRRDFDETLPWDFIDHGITKDALKREYLKAAEEAKKNNPA